jgi:hypothetical protein
MRSKKDVTVEILRGCRGAPLENLRRHDASNELALAFTLHDGEPP